MSENFVGGALPPPSVSWMLNKTAASIMFVNDAQPHLGNVVIKNLVQQIKDGNIVLNSSVDPAALLGE